MQTRPTRSALYIPGSKPRALDKARGLTCDVILFDLEDAVAPDAKIEARSTLHDALAQGGYGGRLKLVRINGLDTDWGADDARAAAKMPCDGVAGAQGQQSRRSGCRRRFGAGPATLGDDGNPAGHPERANHRRPSPA